MALCKLYCHPTLKDMGHIDNRLRFTMHSRLIFLPFYEALFPSETHLLHFILPDRSFWFFTCLVHSLLKIDLKKYEHSPLPWQSHRNEQQPLCLESEIFKFSIFNIRSPSMPPWDLSASVFVGRNRFLRDVHCPPGEMHQYNTKTYNVWCHFLPLVLIRLHPTWTESKDCQRPSHPKSQQHLSNL